jgi:N-acetylmuramoyl-L-alanine amidase
MWTSRALAFTWLLGAADVALAGPKPAPGRSFVVALDAGHGGDADGCRGPDGRVAEKEVTLALARRLRARLRETLPHAEVVLLRDADDAVPLSERVRLANERGADVLVSLHANASPRHDQTGFETWVLDPERQHRESTWMVRSADASVADVALARLSLAGRRDRAVRLAQAIQKEQRRRFPRRADRGVREASLDVLAGAKMPAVLFELGFLDHPLEGPELTRQAFQAEVVEGLSDALVDYYRGVVRRQ